MCTLYIGHIQLFVTWWTVTCQAPLSMRPSRQEYWSGLPFTPPEDLPNPELKPTCLVSLALAVGVHHWGKWSPFSPFPLGKLPLTSSGSGKKKEKKKKRNSGLTLDSSLASLYPIHEWIISPLPRTFPAKSAITVLTQTTTSFHLHYFKRLLSGLCASFTFSDSFPFLLPEWSFST